MDTSMNNTERNISYSVASRRRLVYSSSKIPYRTKTVCHTRFASFFNPTVPFLVFCLTQCARLKGRSEKNKERLRGVSSFQHVVTPNINIYFFAFIDATNSFGLWWHIQKLLYWGLFFDFWLHCKLLIFTTLFNFNFTSALCFVVVHIISINLTTITTKIW